jgi:hypothetical protein
VSESQTRPRYSVRALAGPDSTAQVDVVLTFFGIILIFLSLLAFSIRPQESEPTPTDFRAVEPQTRTVHSPRLAYSVPFYTFLILDDGGLARLNLAPLADRLLASDLDPSSFGMTLKATDGTVYGTLALASADPSSFWLQLDVAGLRKTALLEPLISGSVADSEGLMEQAQALAGKESPGHVMLEYSDSQQGTAQRLMALFLDAGWMMSMESLHGNKLTIRRSPEYFVSTSYFR